MVDETKVYLDILQKRLMSDKATLVPLNRQLLTDMLFVFGRLHADLIKSESELATCRNDRYLDARRSAAELTKMQHLLRRFSCECTEPCDTGKSPCDRWGLREAIGDK
jgi:hypothetical protein